MKKIVSLLWIMTSLIPALYAQHMSGVVTDRDEGKPLPGVIIHNHNKDQNTVSGASGQYRIRADKGDSLSCSLLGYYDIHILMPQSTSIYRKISMRKKLFSLKEVEIRPGWTPYQLDSVERRSIYKIELNRQQEGSIMSPVSLLAEKISRKSRQRWQFQKNFVKWERQKFIDTRYTPELVSRLTGLHQDSLYAFMNSFPLPEDYARTASDLELMMWIKYNYRLWIRSPQVRRLTDINDSSSRSGN